MDSAVAGGRLDEGRSSTDLIWYFDGSHSDSDSDSYSKWKTRVKSLFWYELPISDDVPNYLVLPYPWEEVEKNEEGKEEISGRGNNSWVKETERNIACYDLSAEEEEEVKLQLKFLERSMQSLEGGFFVSMTDSTESWSRLSAAELIRRPWECEGKEEMDIKRSDSSNEERMGPLLKASEGMVMDKSAAACLSSVGDLDVEGGLDAQEQPVCTSTEVLDVRMEMHECFEQGKTYRNLFKSMANRDGLPIRITSSNCDLRESNKPSYPYVFPQLHGMDPVISSKWVRPTTFEGDVQYLQFFPQLVRATEYGETRDHVLAKAIVIARKSFQKMLCFQIDIAVEDCMDFLRIEEAMKRRYNLYYFAVSEIVLNAKDFESVVKSIMNGDSGLRYSLTEFGSSTYLCKAKCREIVHYLVEHFRSEINCGEFKEWSCEETHEQVAQIVCDTVDAEFPSPCHLYQKFLCKKMIAAQELGVHLKFEDIILD